MAECWYIRPRTCRSDIGSGLEVVVFYSTTPSPCQSIFRRGIKVLRVFNSATPAVLGRRNLMGTQERREKIAELEKKLGSTVICFLTSDRLNVDQPTNVITRDCAKIFHHHLPAGKRYDTLSFYLVSHGGDMDVPWEMVKLLRSHCKKLQVVIPYICHSAATMIAIGCDEIIAGPRAQLSPTDPTLNVRTGTDENSPVVQFGVEDINAFLDFVRDTLGRQFHRHGHEALAKLVDRVQPQWLGSMNRTYFRTRLLIEKLLLLRNNKCSKREIDRITRFLNVAYYAHNHAISRDEMREDLSLPVIEAEKVGCDGLIWELYEQYAEEFKSRDPYEMQAELRRSAVDPVTIEIKGKFLENTNRTDTYVRTIILQGAGNPNFNFTIPQVPGVPQQVIQQVIQHFLGELNTQLRAFSVAKQLASFGEWRTE